MKIKQIILIFTLSSISAGCVPFSLFDCQDFVEFEVLSNKYAATVFTRGCGATAPDYPYVNLRKANQKLNFEDEKNQVFLSVNHKEIKLNWRDDSTLIVKCENCLEDDLNKANQKVNKRFADLKIEYQSK